MARDSNGTYSRAASITASTVASSTDMNTELNDIGAEITASLEASGKKVWTGNQNANGYGIKSLLNTKVHTTAGGTTAYTVTTGASLSSIATMAVLFIKMNATNTGASTLNVDGIGATSIVKTGSTAVASGDLVSGYVYAVLYDGTNWQLLNVATSGAFQPLDATLTALAALSHSSLTPVIQFTAADVVSLTSAPKVTTIELGDATDTTLARSSAGNMSIEGNVVYRAGGTDVALADGGTGASLTDPNADRIMFWDDSAGAVDWLTVGSNIAISGTSMTVTEPWMVAASDEATAITAGTGKVTWVFPYDVTVLSVGASANTAGTALTIDINEAGTTILSTKITLDSGEKTSLTAATAAVISDTAVTAGNEMSVDFDTVTGTWKGVKVWMLVRRSA